MLQRLDTGKANGPDAISVRMLRHTASAIAPSVSELFNLSIRTWSALKGLESFSCSAHSKAAWGKVSFKLQAHIPIVCSEQSPRKAFLHAHI